MQIVIDISEETYNEVCWRGLSLCPRGNKELVKAIKKGIPLPKGHGRLIDGDELYEDFIDGTEGYDCNTWNRIEIGYIIEGTPTIIKADKAESEE